MKLNMESGYSGLELVSYVSLFTTATFDTRKKNVKTQASAGHVLGYHWFVSQTCGLMFFAAWAILNLDQRVVLRGLLFMLIEAFFKEFDNSMCDVPKSGPALLACGPHANQLVDSIVVLKSLYKREDIGFLTASKTMKSKYFGQMARILRSIPVTRPQDEAVPGRGRVSVIDTKL